MSDRKLFSARSYAIIGVLAITGVAMAQDQPQDQGPHPWRTAGDADQNQVDPQYQGQQPPFDQNRAQQFPQQPYPQQYPQQQYPQQYPQRQQYPQSQQYPQQQNSQYAPPPANYNVPAHLTIRPGTYLTVRTTQWLSSDRNQPGDSFQATLDQPIIVDGVVVAHRGQQVGGRVTEAQKAGRVEGTSRLGVELTDITLADGSVVPIQSQMLVHQGPTSTGRDVGAVAGTTALGATIGALADWGRGAAIGAGAGAAAGVLGVLLTRGQPTVIPAESVMTFQIGAPVEVVTDRAPQAFRYANNQDYAPQTAGFRGPRSQACFNCGVPPPPAYYPRYGYPGYGYPAYPYYGPGLSVYVGPGFYGGRYRGYGRFRR